ncbi:hypothetical protein [Brevibacillus humidisoli]|nr:hypothetical protein [Brevibacillus humidisoli]
MNWFYLTLSILTFIAAFYLLFKGSAGFQTKRRKEDEDHFL